MFGYSLYNNFRVSSFFGSELILGDLCPKQGQLRPNVVWFGEAVPMMDVAIEIVKTAKKSKCILASITFLFASSAFLFPLLKFCTIEH